MDYDGREVEAHLRERLTGFRLYEDWHHVGANVGDCVAIKYAPTDRDWKNRGSTRFTLQVEPDVCYILGFYIQQDFWRQGHGTSLVNLIADFVVDEFGVKRFVTTPSGMSKENKFYESCGFRYFNESEVELVV